MKYWCAYKLSNHNQNMTFIFDKNLICTKVFKKFNIPNVRNNVFKISNIGNMKI